MGVGIVILAKLPQRSYLMPLNDTAIRNAKPEAKQKKLYDSGGLYLLVKPNGGKW